MLEMTVRNTRLALLDNRISNFAEGIRNGITSRDYFIKCREIIYGNKFFKGSATIYILGQDTDTPLPQDVNKLFQEINICDAKAFANGSKTVLGISGWVYAGADSNTGPENWSKSFSFER